jgi:DNA-binding beta-propeller fold protein YncE
VAWDRAGNIYVADGLGNNNRVAKFDKDGRFIAHWGSTGTGQGQFMGVRAIAIDAQDNVYVADREQGSGLRHARGVQVGFSNSVRRALRMTRGLPAPYISHGATTAWRTRDS